MTKHSIPQDLSIPAFLRTTTAGTPHQAPATTAPTEKVHGYGASCWEEMQKPTELNQQLELRAAVREYQEQKRFAAWQQYCIENPELVAMNRKAKRDAERRIAKLGVAPAARRSR